MTSIQPERLNQIRRARGLGRPRLAKLSGLTERQIARLEGAVPARDTCTEDTVLRLASALQVRPEALTSSTPITSEDFLVVPQARCCSRC
ncbi:helix-turn-helix transcriptional regulator [Falsirhodobacter sp. 1013]|uniref:helix-turn-helix transcriptional regulator n=1 Tax=Falsirhodobacter sp. 1013 TaxID=3417566 RepID=UPI003EBBDA3C